MIIFMKIANRHPVVTPLKFAVINTANVKQNFLESTVCS